MGATIAIMWRELNARRDLLWLALAVAAIVFLLPFMPGLEGQQRADVWETTSAILALAVGFVLAIGLGATTFGADLSEGRLGFYFARPLNGAPVWVGRITAVVTLVLISELLILIPVAFIRPGNLKLLTRFGWWGLVPFILAPVALVFLAHAVSMMARARTAWLALDVIGFLSAAVAVWVVLRPLMLWGNRTAVWSVGLAFLVAAIIALALAGAAGVIFGRTDLRRAHGALSLALWISLAAGWAGAASYGHWVHNFGPRDLGEAWLEKVDPTGTWAVVEGTAPSRFEIARGFIVSLKDDRYVPLLRMPRYTIWYQEQPVFSDSGGASAWLVDGPEDRQSVLWWVDLTADDPKPIQTTITSDRVREIALSPNGSRVLMVTDGGLISVYDLIDESLVSMARLPERLQHTECSFVSETAVRCQSKRYYGKDEEAKWRVAELDTDTGEISVTGEIDYSGTEFSKFNSGIHSAVMALIDCPGDDCRLRLYDPRTAELRQERPLPEWAEYAGFLRDGRLFIGRSGAGRTLAVGLENPDTGEWITHEFDESPGVRLGHEALPGQLVMEDLGQYSRDSEVAEPCQLFNLETGETAHIGPVDSATNGLGDLQGLYRSSIAPVEWEPGVWHLLLTTDKGIIRWDPETDELVTVAGGAG